MKFPTADLLFALCEVEDQFLKLSQGVVDENKYTQPFTWKCREMGRAHGLLVAAHLIAERIEKIDKQIGK